MVIVKNLNRLWEERVRPPRDLTKRFTLLIFVSVIANKASVKQALNHVVGIRKETLN